MVIGTRVEVRLPYLIITASPDHWSTYVVLVWKLDHLGRNLKHLVMALDELAVLGVAFVSLNEGIDTTTPAGRLQLHILGAIAEFERARCAERVRAGLARVKAQGRRLAPSRAIVPCW